jgi:hypothetical protein
VQLSVTIEPGRTFGIQAAPDLVQWTDLWRATNNGGENQFLDWSVTNGIRRFYRIVTP